MNFFWSNPVLRSLLIGVFTVGGTVLFLGACMPGLHDSDVGSLFGLPHNLSRGQIVTIVQISWAWIALSIIGSYILHTWHLDRTTHPGKLADTIMWFQYVVLLLLALWLYLGIPDAAKPGNEPFFG
jgi:hypothetical protein